MKTESLRKYSFSIYLVIIFIIPLQFCSLSISGKSLYGTDLLTILLCGLFLLLKFKERIILPPRPALALFGLAALCMIGSTFAGINPKQSIISLVGKMLLAALFFISYDIVRSKEDISKILNTLAISAGAVAICGISGTILFYAGSTWNPFFWGYGQLAPGPYPRICASFKCPQELGLYLGLALFFLLAAYSYSDNKKIKTAIIAILAGLIPSVIFCLSRDIFGIISGLTIFMLLTWLYRRRFCFTGVVLANGLMLSLFAVFVLSTVFFITPFRVKIHAGPDEAAVKNWTLSFGNNSEEGTAGLSDQALISVNMHYHDKVYYFMDMCRHLEKRPMLGIGPGIPASHNNLYNIERDMHNTYFQILVQQGWAGFILTVLFVGVIVFDSFRSLRGMDERDLKMYLLFASAIGAALFAAYFNHHANVRILWLIFALVPAFRRVLTQPTGNAVLTGQH